MREIEILDLTSVLEMMCRWKSLARLTEHDPHAHPRLLRVAAALNVVAEVPMVAWVRSRASWISINGGYVAISASLSGRLRNTTLPISRPLLPLFEAVVNAIQSIEAAQENDLSGGLVKLYIKRALPNAAIPNLLPGPRPLEPITGFVIEDNGEGFKPDNIKSFETLDSEQKIVKGCRGIGRLLWLKAFDKVNVESVHRSADNFVVRKFEFKVPGGVENMSEFAPAAAGASTGSRVELLGFHERFRKTAPKSASAIANDVLEHCLWYFARPGGAPQILVIDEAEQLSLQELFENYMQERSETVTVAVKEIPFAVVHLKLRAAAKQNPEMLWFAGNRVVLEENLSGKVPGLYGALGAPGSEFVYACYVESPFLDLHVRADRTSFDIPEKLEGTLLEDEIALSDIRSSVLLATKSFLSKELETSQAAGIRRVEQFVNEKAPRYRPILSRIGKEKLGVDPTIPDRELELQLHRHLTDIEAELLVEGQKVLGGPLEGDGDYEKRLTAYLEKVEEVKKSDLAAYVSRRRVILDLFARAIERGPDGKHVREQVIHSLIMPQRETSNDYPMDACNLWLIDERLAFHDYLASDVPFKEMAILDSEERLRPDLLALKLYESPVLVSERPRPPLSSIVVVEIKRPMRDDATGGEEKDPLSQALRYVRKVRDGKVRTAKGRQIRPSEDIPAYCYVLADLTPSMVNRCMDSNLRRTQDGLGYFGYNDNYRAYIEVISFDGILKSAAERSQAFFGRLGLRNE